MALVEELKLVNLRLLAAARNGGKGSAVRRGMLAAQGDYILFTDADNSTPIEQFDKLLQKVQSEGYDIAVGSRVAEGAQELHRSLLRRASSGGLRLLQQRVLRIEVRDTQCGFKLFTRAAVRHLYNRQTLTGFSFDLEILYLAAHFGYRVAEVPVAWIDAPGSKVTLLKEARRFLYDIAKIKLNDWRGVYTQARRATLQRQEVEPCESLS